MAEQCLWSVQEFADEMNRIRMHHKMRERGVSVDAYTSVAVANLAANAQLEKLRDKELAGAPGPGSPA
ncbi:hypothetical protein FOA52_014529 [Chlamydomonas sp. UWO 241]|nr:hypothetical protein FOA52_014529 [Chlamydomonas sp. UWO 241]